MSSDIPFYDITEKFAHRLEAARAAGGDTRFLEAMDSAPQLGRFYFGHFYKEIFYDGVLPIRIKELVRLRLSQLHGCAT